MQSEVNNTPDADFCDRIFCAKPKLQEHLSCLQADSCNAGNHSILDDSRHRQNDGKYPEAPAFSCGPQLTVANNTKIPKLFWQLLGFFLSSILYMGIKTKIH